MPNIAGFHPQIVHFVVALLVIGVGMRIVSLTRLLPFTNHAAAALLLIGTVSAYLAVRSGTEAHGPVERIPGVRDTVRFLRVESLLLDTKDYPAALAALDSLALASTDARFGARKATMAADVPLAMGHADSARARLTSAIAAFPQNTRLKSKLDSLK